MYTLCDKNNRRRGDCQGSFESCHVRCNTYARRHTLWDIRLWRFFLCMGHFVAPVARHFAPLDSCVKKAHETKHAWCTRFKADIWDILFLPMRGSRAQLPQLRSVLVTTTCMGHFKSKEGFKGPRTFTYCTTLRTFDFVFWCSHWTTKAQQNTSLPAMALCLPEPVMSSKMMKALNDFLKKKQAIVQGLRQSCNHLSLRAPWAMSMGLPFTAMKGWLTEFQRRSPEILLNAVKELKSGHHQDPQIIADTFSGAYALMSATNEVTLHQPSSEGEFSIAQAILLQLVANSLGTDAVAMGRYHLDERRFIFVVLWGVRFLAIPVYFGESLQEVSEPGASRVCDFSETQPWEIPWHNHGDFCQLWGCRVRIRVRGCSHHHFMCPSTHWPGNLQACKEPSTSCWATIDVLYHSPQCWGCSTLPSCCRAEAARDFLAVKSGVDASCLTIPWVQQCGLLKPSKWCGSSPRLGWSDSLSRHFLDFQTGMVPFTFPPAIDDWDRRMQNNMMQTGFPFLDQEEAASYFCDKLEEFEVDLYELDNIISEFPLVSDEDDLIASAKLGLESVWAVVFHVCLPYSKCFARSNNYE